MSSLAKKLSDILGAAFEAQGLPHTMGTVKVSDRPDLAQFQCNGAMAAAKISGKKPREVAETIINILSTNPVFAKLEIAGPGFINLTVTDLFLSGFLNETGKSNDIGISKTGKGTIVLDYGGMNVAKAMHVGHLRPTVIGACLKNIVAHAGYNALGDIHTGDWGLQMGQIISEFEIRNPGWAYFDPSFTGRYPDQPPFEYHELEEIYPMASAACKDDPARLERARKATAELQEGRAGYRALLRHFIDLSIKDIKNNLAPLKIEFDIWKGESDAAPLVPEIANDLLKRGIAMKHEGALIIPVALETDKKEMPPLIFFKSDGAMTYGTTDIATIYDRVKTYADLSKIIYVVDHRQSLHLEQVFRAARKAGYTENIELRHIGNGTVNGPDGKPFKTREGKAMTFRDMVATAITRARARIEEAHLAEDASLDEKSEIGRIVAMAALKFNELSNQPHIDYVFDIDRMISFEGKTGPYLLYQAVRIKSLLRKADYETLSPLGRGQSRVSGEGEGENLTPSRVSPPSPNPLPNGERAFVIQNPDRPLALALCELPDHFESALNNLSPHILCEHAYKLAQEFSAFYAACHILSESDSALRQSRLALCDLTYRQLALILDLLGIEIPDRM
jgi:arginyl-tRNA synthetase